MLFVKGQDSCILITWHIDAVPKQDHLSWSLHWPWVCLFLLASHSLSHLPFIVLTKSHFPHSYDMATSTLLTLMIKMGAYSFVLRTGSHQHDCMVSQAQKHNLSDCSCSVCVWNLIFHPIQRKIFRGVFEFKKQEVTGNKSFGFDFDRYSYSDCIKEDDKRCSVLHRQRRLEIVENNKLAELKWKDHFGCAGMGWVLLGYWLDRSGWG